MFVDRMTFWPFFA